MKRRAEANVAQAIANFPELSIWELRVEWRRHHRMSPPMRLSRDLLIRGIACKLQEHAYGGLSKPTLRKLASLAIEHDGTAVARRQPAVLKPGTRLVREWHGETHTVLVHADGFEWQGQHYRSLTILARQITGAHWSGPRFFGLTRRTASLDNKDGLENVQD